MSQSERSQLILQYLPLVRWVAGRIRQKLPNEVTLDDLVSIGTLGLIAAIDKFDSSYDVKLATYAEYRIRGAILDSLREMRGLPAHKLPKAKRIRCAQGAAAQRHGRTPEADEVAAELGISINEYNEWLLDVRATKVASLDRPYEFGTQTVNLMDIVAAGDTDEPYRHLEEKELWKVVNCALFGLPPVQYKVMRLYYGEGWRLAEIAKHLRVHSSRVFQLKTRATERIRSIVFERWAPKGAVSCER